MKYTKRTLILMTLLLFTTSAFSQYSRFGVKAGLNLANMTVEGNNDNNLKYGLHAGIFNKMMITDAFAIQPELLYSSKGFKNNFNIAGIVDSEADFNLNYIELPVKLVYNLSEDFNFQLGPYFGYLLGANVDANTDILDEFDLDNNTDIDRDRFKAFDVGLTAGLGFTFDPLVVGFTYNLGLTQVADDVATEAMLGDAKNTVIRIYAGLMF